MRRFHIYFHSNSEKVKKARICIRDFMYDKNEQEYLIQLTQSFRRYGEKYSINEQCDAYLNICCFAQVPDTIESITFIEHIISIPKQKDKETNFLIFSIRYSRTHFAYKLISICRFLFWGMESR